VILYGNDLVSSGRPILGSTDGWVASLLVFLFASSDLLSLSLSLVSLVV
jgi:hypothetical protein